MATIIAEATDTAVEVTFTISDSSGPVTGLTVAASCYDRSRDGGDGNIWLQGAGPAWSTGKVTVPLTEVGGGLYAGSINTSSATGRNLIVLFDYSGSVSGVDSDQLILVDALANASAADLATVDANVDAVLVDTGTTIPATLSGLATPGSAMTLSPNAMNAAALATDAVTEIRNAILSDGTAFSGASIAAILAATGTDIPARLAGIEGAGFVTGTDSLEAIRDQGDAAWTTGAGSSAAATAAAVWDAVATAYNDAGSMGELLNGAGGAFTPAQVAAAVWTEALASHLGAGQAAQFVSDILDDTAAIQPDAAAILADTAAMQPVIVSNLDAPVSTRTAPAVAQLVGSFQANAITAAALAADAGTEIAAAVDAALVAAHGAGSYQTATGFAVPGSSMALTGAAEVAVVDAVWDESQASHVGAGTLGASVNAAGSGADAGAIADAVWDEAQAGHVTVGTFGEFLDSKVSDAGGAIDEAGVRSAIGMASANLDTQLATKATSAALATSDGKLDTIISTGGTGPWTSGSGLTVQQIVDGIWDEVLAGNHDGAGSAGLTLQSASVGGVDLDLLTTKVWSALVVDHQAEGSMGLAQAEAAATETVRALLNSAISAVRRYGPVLIKQPIAGKDEIHAGDTGVILTIPVILDGNYSDLSDATSIEFSVTAPDKTVYLKSGMGVTTPTGSYTTWTSDTDAFTTSGRWVVKVTVTWPDLTTKQSIKYPVDVVAASAL